MEARRRRRGGGGAEAEVSGEEEEARRRRQRTITNHSPLHHGLGSNQADPSQRYNLTRVKPSDSDAINAVLQRIGSDTCKMTNPNKKCAGGRCPERRRRVKLRKRYYWKFASSLIQCCNDETSYYTIRVESGYNRPKGGDESPPRSPPPGSPKLLGPRPRLPLLPISTPEDSKSQ